MEEAKNMENNNTNQESQTKKYNKSDNSTGAIWERINSQGTEYLSIRINVNGETLHYKAFLNGGKNLDDPNCKKPDFLIYPSLNFNKNNNKNNKYIEKDNE